MTIQRAESDGVMRWVHTLAPAAELAAQIAETEFVPGAMRGKPDVITACIMFGDEIGLGPMQALSSIHVVDGRPFPSAELLRALVLREGHSLRVVESTGTRCTVTARRRGQPDHEAVTVDWTIEMARAAGLAGRGAWRTYPRAMLLARASADACRMVFPDVVKGLGHVPDTDGAVTNEWVEYAATLGPDQPAPPELENVRWSPQPGGETPGAKTPHAAPGEPPWGDESADTPEAVKPAPVAPSGPWPDDPPAAGPAPIPDAPQTAEDTATRPPDDATIRRIMAAYGDLPFSRERAERLAVFSALLGQPVESTRDLDRMAAYRLLGALHRVKTGELIAISDGHGGYTVHPGSEPPEGDES